MCVVAGLHLCCHRGGRWRRAAEVVTRASKLEGLAEFGSATSIRKRHSGDHSMDERLESVENRKRMEGSSSQADRKSVV